MIISSTSYLIVTVQYFITMVSYYLAVNLMLQYNFVFYILRCYLAIFCCLSSYFI